MRALEYLDQRARFGMKLGLEPMRRLLEELRHPEGAAPVVVVAGTNGKGSVVVSLDAALRRAGRRVGRYTSPHLQRVHERIAVGADIDDDGLEDAVGRVRTAAEALVGRGALADHPTYFEVLTAAALVHFAGCGVDVALLEVGLGGRLDATNATDPVVSAVVRVALDHTQHLGWDLESIAREKAGVMRRNRPTVRGPMPAVAARVLEECAAETGARLVDATRGARVEDAGPGRVDVLTARGRYADLRPLPGAHQRANLLVAIGLLEAIEDEGLIPSAREAAAGVSDARWPGRLQELPGTPHLLLDGAHNPEAARALAEHLAGSDDWVLLFAAMADKDIESMAAALFPGARAVVLTALDVERAASPVELARRTGASSAPRTASVARGLERARRLAGPAGRVVVAGSLYLVGAVLDLLDRESRAG